MTRQRRLLAINAAILLIIAAIVIGVSVGVTNKKKNENSSSLNSAVAAENTSNDNDKSNNPTMNNVLQPAPSPVHNHNTKTSSAPVAMEINVSESPSSPSIKSPKPSASFRAPTIFPTDTVLEQSASPVVDVGLPGELRESAAAGIAYFHCIGQRSSTDAPLHEFILLHGASFTKEIWNTSGILDIFCNDHEDTSVIALDLSISAKHDDLQLVIDALKQSGVVKNLPISGIVTPSASGATINDWIFNGNLTSLKEQFMVWIPVSSPSIADHTPQNYTDTIGDWDVLAIYGDQDSAGKKISQRVTSGVNESKTVELQGGHAVYLQSPNDFVKTVVQYVLKYDSEIKASSTVPPISNDSPPSVNNVTVPNAMPTAVATSPSAPVVPIKVTASPSNIKITTVPTAIPTTMAMPTSSPVRVSGGVDMSLVGTIQNGTAAGIAYFHCFSKRSSNTAPLNELILLHGASFTKEIWETSGILDIFCGSKYEDTAVTALDLSISATNDELQTVMDDLKLTGVIRTLPLAGIVTPSASGATIVDWIFNGDVTSLKNQINVWIPVASPSIFSYTDQDYTNTIGDWHVLAIYGDQDKSGKKISERVASGVTDSKVVELQGGHPVYLQSPDEFVDTVLDFVSNY